MPSFICTIRLSDLQLVLRDHRDYKYEERCKPKYATVTTLPHPQLQIQSPCVASEYAKAETGIG